MDLTDEQQKIAQIRGEGMRILGKSIAVDFKPILNKIKELVEQDAPKEDIFREIDRLLGIIAQVERFSERTRNMEKEDE